MSKYIEKKKKPVLPIYLAGLTWLVCGLILPLYQPLPLAVTVLLSVAVYGVGIRFCPDRVVRVEVPFHSGVSEVDELLGDIQRNLDRLNELNDQIPDDSLSKAITRMEKAGRSIVSEVETHPEKARLIRRFASYYLSDCIKILETYAELEIKGVKGVNSNGIKREIDQNAQAIAIAFENQLDALYRERSLEVDADLRVLDSILKGNGLL